MYTDEYGVQFSDNKKELFDFPEKFQGEYIIPEGTIELFGYAFSNCTDLKSLHIPCSLPAIQLDDCGIENLKGLVSFEVAEGHPNLCAVDGVLFNKEMTWLLRYPPMKAGTSYVIPEGVQYIGLHAFSHCHTLESVIIPPTIKGIDLGAFSDCTNLKSITIPQLAIPVINECVFQGCSNLKTVQLPDNIIGISNKAFADCKQLASINIPKELNKVVNGAFAGCDALRDTKIYTQLLELGYSDEEIDRGIIDDIYGYEYASGDSNQCTIPYAFSGALVTIRIFLKDKELIVASSNIYPSIGGFGDQTKVYELENLMSVLGINSKDVLIDALIEKCKTDWCLWDMDRFFNFLSSQKIEYTHKVEAVYVPDDEVEGYGVHLERNV